MLKVFFLPDVQVYGHILIKFRDLCSQITAAGMNDKILISLRIRINLNKVIASAERADASFKPLCILQIAAASERRKVKMLLSAFPHPSAARNAVRRPIKRFKVDIRPAEINRIHSAANIHADHIGNDLINDRHRCADRTALSCMNIRHDTYF